LLTKPELAVSGAATATVSRDGPIDLAFTRGVAGVELWASLAGPQTWAILCRFPSEAGTGLISSRVAAAIPAGSELSLYTVRVQQETVAGFPTTVAVGGQVFAPDLHRLARVIVQ
jgi:hypothetical protein